jgi:ATP-dependent Clp protease ATP-binding subunit ClpX
MLDVMYEIPSRPEIKRCVITLESVERRARPILITAAEAKRLAKEKPAS